MTVWFDGSGDINCSIDDVKRSFGDLGEHYVGVVGLMPGMTSVELVAQTPDSVTIKTNEGLMTRTNISRRDEAESVVVEFDEVYEAGSKVTATSYFSHQFTSSANGVTHRIIIRNVDAPGFLGFFYRKFGSSKMGNAFLTAYASYLENR